jgi:hypothetical protein
MEKRGDIQFIDADTPYLEEKQSYEELVVRQMGKCAEVLSKEITGGIMQTKRTKMGEYEQYIENVAEQQINTVDTFRILLIPLIKNDIKKDGAKDKLEKINKEIEKFREDLNNRLILVYGRGYKKISELKNIRADHPIYKELVDFKAKKSRDIFEILVLVYYENKEELARLSIEEDE